MVYANCRLAVGPCYSCHRRFDSGSGILLSAKLDCLVTVPFQTLLKSA